MVLAEYAPDQGTDDDAGVPVVLVVQAAALTTRVSVSVEAPNTPPTAETATVYQTTMPLRERRHLERDGHRATREVVGVVERRGLRQGPKE